MRSFDDVVRILETVLGLGSRARTLTPETALLGSIPEFDSMAVVSVLTSLEETYGFTVEDDEVDADTFVSVGSLAAFVDRKLDQ